MLSAERLRAIWAQRCPVCLQGAMFQGGLSTHERCAVCGHRFLREPGFFQGAMYVSYGLAIGTFVVLLFLARALFERWLGFALASVVAMVAQLFLVPVLFRYSRVIWAHLNIGTRA